MLLFVGQTKYYQGITSVHGYTQYTAEKFTDDDKPLHNMSSLP